MIDDPGFGLSYDLVGNCYIFHPTRDSLLRLADKWNPSLATDLDNQNYVDLAPGKYNLAIGDHHYQVTIAEEQVVTLPAGQIVR